MPKRIRNDSLRPVWAALALGLAMPMGARADDGYLGDLGSAPSIVILLASLLVLLVGILLRLQQMRNSLAKKTAALEKSERRLRLMGDNLPNATLFQLECTPDGGFSFRHLSKGHEQPLGIEHKRVMEDAKLVFEHLYEADLPTLKEAYRKGVEELAPADLDIRMLDISGNLRWLRIGAVPHRDGESLVWDGFVQDITESRNIEAALVEESRNFQNLFETIDDLLVVCDTDGNLLHTNQTLEKRLGYSHEELAGMSLFELYPEPLRTEAYQVVALMQTEQTSSCTLPLQSKDGETIQAEMKIFQGLWKNKEAIFGVVHDIANKRQTELALRESQRMLQLILDTIPLSVFWKDKDSVYIGSNSAFARECGLSSAEDTVGKTPFDLFDAETARKLVAHDQHMIAANQPQLNMLQSHTPPHGGTRWREVSKIPLRNEDGDAVGILGVWRDVTQQKHAEERLKHTLEDMERFNQLMRGRERRTLELKSEINKLLKQLELPEKYRTTTDDLA